MLARTRWARDLFVVAQLSDDECHRGSHTVPSLCPSKPSNGLGKNDWHVNWAYGVVIPRA